MEPFRFDESAALRLIIWGDPQLASLHPDREVNFEAACKTVKNANAPVDALVIAGDVTEFGRATEYAAVQRCLTIAAKNTDHIFCVPGNHDIRVRHHVTQCARFARFLSGIPNAVPNPGSRFWFSREIKGYRFIFLGADKTCFEGSYLSREQLRWLSSELALAGKTGRPAFVFNHQPLKHTNGLPKTWGGNGSWRGSVGDQNDALRAVLKKHGAVLFCTGHLHYGVSRYNLENSGKLHMLNAPAIGCANHGPNSAPGQGFALEVYPDRIEGTALLFRTGEAMDESIPNARFTIPLGE